MPWKSEGKRDHRTQQIYDAQKTFRERNIITLTADKAPVIADKLVGMKDQPKLRETVALVNGRLGAEPSNDYIIKDELAALRKRVEAQDAELRTLKSAPADGEALYPDYPAKYEPQFPSYPQSCTGTEDITAHVLEKWLVAEMLADRISPFSLRMLAGNIEYRAKAWSPANWKGRRKTELDSQGIKRVHSPKPKFAVDDGTETLREENAKLRDDNNALRKEMSELKRAVPGEEVLEHLRAIIRGKEREISELKKTGPKVAKPMDPDSLLARTQAENRGLKDRIQAINELTIKQLAWAQMPRALYGGLVKALHADTRGTVTHKTKDATLGELTEWWRKSQTRPAPSAEEWAAHQEKKRQERAARQAAKKRG
jgi:hypothetical protein